jgi:lipoyl(octanoyl) transferase
MTDESLRVIDLGTMRYRDAWDRQLVEHDAVVEGTQPECVLLVEHFPVITLGRQSDKALANVLWSKEQLAKQGVELVESDRGGNVTFHGPGQLVMYPIIRLGAYGLSVGGYMKLLEDVVIELLGEMGIESQLNEKNVGVWTSKDPKWKGQLAKICAMGVRVKRGVTMHGLALNVTTNLKFFELIVPCGLSLPVTSVREIVGEEEALMEVAKVKLVKIFREKLKKIRRGSTRLADEE